MVGALSCAKDGQDAARYRRGLSHETSAVRRWENVSQRTVNTAVVVTVSQSAVRRSFQQLRRRRIHSVNVVNFQWTVFISNFMHMRDKTVCGF